MEKFAKILGEIKELKRTGWQLRNIDNGESVADHSFGVSLLTLLFCPKNLDKAKCLEFAIIHDLAEVITGDYTPGEISKDEKHKLECEAIKKISIDFDYPELVEKFNEYEAQECEEAKFVKKADRLDTVLQAKYYTDENRTDDYADGKYKWNSLFDEFHTNNPESHELIEIINQKRKRNG